jgi:hypothetical protein
VQRALDRWLTEDESHATAYNYLAAQVEAGTRSQFYRDLLDKALRYGNLTPRQVAAVLRSIEQDATRAAERAAETKGAPPLAEGRRTVTGEVVSVRWRDGQFPGYKMTVRDADGNRVWGSLATSLDPELNPSLNDLGIDTYEGLVGRTVSMTATVARSDDDPHFGFFKRPASAHYVLPPAPTTRLTPPAATYIAPHEPVCTRGWESTDGECSHCEELLASGMSLVEDEG